MLGAAVIKDNEHSLVRFRFSVEQGPPLEHPTTEQREACRALVCADPRFGLHLSSVDIPDDSSTCAWFAWVAANQPARIAKCAMIHNRCRTLSMRWVTERNGLLRARMDNGDPNKPGRHRCLSHGFCPLICFPANKDSCDAPQAEESKRILPRCNSKKCHLTMYKQRSDAARVVSSSPERLKWSMLVYKHLLVPRLQYRSCLTPGFLT